MKVEVRNILEYIYQINYLFINEISMGLSNRSIIDIGNPIITLPDHPLIYDLLCQSRLCKKCIYVTNMTQFAHYELYTRTMGVC